MKAAKNCILVFKDAEGFGDAIINALQPSPSSDLYRLEDSFELSLDSYGIKNVKASGKIVHFVNRNGEYQVSLFLLENYKPPVLVCALNEVLASLVGENSSEVPTLVVPFLVSALKLKLENKNSLTAPNFSLYGIQYGPVAELVEAVASKVQKAPPSLQIYHEQLACLLQVLRVLKMPTFVIVGQYMSTKTLEEFQEVTDNVGELLAAYSSLTFQRERIEWNPVTSSLISEEPWRALYG